ncbi:MAG: YdbH domain-containing protein [Gammaproteobacteria bacterium]|nr:YdbH domain-containing protein [Gammaproteobacteria bacterium]
MKWVLAFIAMLLAAAGGVYAGLPWIVQTVIVQQAAAQGIVVSELQIQRPVWGSAVVDRIAFSVGANDAMAEAIVIGFTLDSLLSAKATAIEIETVQVALRPDTSAPTQSIGVGELIGTVPALLASTWQMMPADSFSVDEMLVGFAGIDFAGAMDFSDESASLRGRLGGLESVPSIEIACVVDRAGKLRAEIREAGVSNNIFELNVDLESARGTLSGSWALALDENSGSLDLAVHGSAPFALTDAGWVIESGLAAEVEADEWEAAFDVAGAQGLWSPEPEQLARVQGSWRAALRIDPVMVLADGSVSVFVGTAGVQLALGSGTQVVINGLAGDDWSVADARFELTQNAQLQFMLEPFGFRLQSPAYLAAHLQQVAWSEYRLSPTLDLTLRELVGDLNAVDSAWQLEVPALQLSGTARVGADLPGGPFTIALVTEQHISQPLLANLLVGEPWAYDVDAGLVELRATFQVGGAELDELAGSGSLTLVDLSAHYDEIEITGINTEITLGFEQGAWQLGPDRVELALADVGFPVTDLAASVTLNSEQVLLADLTGRTLGGSVSVASMAYDIDSGSAEFALEVLGVQLADVLALEGETVTGSATLDGSLPMQIKNDQARVSNGRFSARPPGGVLKYGGAEEIAAALNQPGVGFALAALGDFRFGVLDVNVDYAPEGDLLLGIHLEGHNPRFEDGRAIHYNLNISENIPVLLQSLQLSDELSRRLEKRLQQ